MLFVAETTTLTAHSGSFLTPRATTEDFFLTVTVVMTAAKGTSSARLTSISDRKALNENGNGSVKRSHGIQRLEIEIDRDRREENGKEGNVTIQEQ